MPGILGTRLRREREERGLTQEALARAVGLSGEFISNLERGRRMPSLETLTALASFFKKEISFFLREKEEAFSVLLGGEREDKKTKEAIRKFKKYCEDFMQLEELTGRRLELAPSYTHPSAERMAEEERRRLGLGYEPVRDIFSLLELNGLHVLQLPIAEESRISGAFIFFEAEKAAFAMVNSHQSYDRQVFTAVHEYCHYLRDRFSGPIIDHPDIFIDEYLPLYHPRETFAQTFASRFLVPPERLRSIVDKDFRSRRLSYADILYLKEYFGVSTPDLLQALRDLGYISSSKYEEYLKLKPPPAEEAIFRAAVQGRQPKGRAIPSQRFKSLALEAFQRKKISGERLARLLNMKKERRAPVLKTAG